MGPAKRDYVYKTASQEDRRMGSWVTAVGHYVSYRYRAPLRARDESLIAYCVQGKGHLHMGTRDYTFGPGDLVLQPAHVPHICSCDPQLGWEVWWILFGGSSPQQLLSAVGLNTTSPILSIGKNTELPSHFAAAYQALESGATSSQLDATQHLFLFLFALRRQQLQHSDEIFQASLQMNYKMRSLDEVVAASGYSKHHFIRLFKQATGITPWAYVLRLKIDRAKVLLLDPRCSIKKVSEEIGIENALYFSRLFRKHTGMSPTEFRQTQRPL
ncbi:MAG: AraC family transcriptional regulator [Myxococcales bacterium]|nr:AraC family transcriptional regulator [Myxococcales bacterium]MCB9643214.1 AraC family transcriptional regulator [Myxococcales bacterium]